jgi:putative DNA primase/helicase
MTCRTVRWHDGIRAIVALMTDARTGEPIGCHRTFLNPDGTKLERKMLGRQGVIRLSPGDVTQGLGICEGIEDGLALLISDRAPVVWAATCAGLISRFPVLGSVEHLTIFADADEPGMRAARACAARWSAAGKRGEIRRPTGEKDWAEVLRRAAA